MIVFANPGFLWGLLAAALPWILRRRVPREIPRVPFAFISFLREVESREFLSPRVQEWLLLVIRILIIVGLVLAASDPLWVSGGFGLTGDQVRAALDSLAAQETVLMIDRSASMQKRVEGISAWELAVQQAKQVMLSDPGRAWALGFWTDGKEMTASLTDQLYRGNVDDLVHILQNTKPVESPSDFQRLVIELERGSLPGTILLFTDHQASSWANLLKRQLSERESPVRLRVVCTGARPAGGLWIEVAGISSFPWMVGLEEEIEVSVHQWGKPAGGELLVQLRAERGEPLTLAETSCPLESAPGEPTDQAIKHTVRLRVRLGEIAGDMTVLPVSLVALADGPEGPVVARLSGEIPVFSDRKIYILGRNTVSEAVKGCFRSEDGASAVRLVELAEINEVPTGGLLVTTLSSILAASGGGASAAAWVRRGGKCLLVIDAPVDSVANTDGPGMLLHWEEEQSGTASEIPSIQQDHPIGRAFSGWPEEVWREWRSFTPGHAVGADSIVWLKCLDGGRTDLIGESNPGLGRVVFVNISSTRLPLRSPLFPVAVVESIKRLAGWHDLERPLRPGPQPEYDTRPLSDSVKEIVERTGAVRFLGVDEVTQAAALPVSPTPLRSAVLGAVVLLGLLELWVANRGLSAK